jgi:uncharacterized protein (UPF0210 family)
MNLGWFATFAAMFLFTAAAQADPPPRVRAITAFVRVDPKDLRPQIDEALKVLRSVRSAFAARGYETQTIRIVTQPLAQLIAGRDEAGALGLLKALDDLGREENFIPNVGPAMQKDGEDPRPVRVLEQALASLSTLQGSTRIADDDGIHWGVIKETAHLVRYLTEHSPHSQGNFAFTATAMLKPYGPFYPGAYHDGAGRKFSIGFESANVVQAVFTRTHGDFDRSVAELTAALTIHARAAEAVGDEIARKTGWEFMGTDPTPAPLGDASIADAIERYSGARFGSSGTLTAALAITSAVKAVPVKQVGYSGLMVPVLEDKRIAQRWGEGLVSTDALLAYSAVCGTGLDTVPYPGDISLEQIERILGDVAALAYKWHKPLSARLQPVLGKRAGDMTDFSGPFLFNSTLHPVP